MTESLDARLEGRFGAPLRHLPVTDSTNTQALAWAAEGAPEGALVVADEQSAGRGRHGRRWEDAGGKSLLMSLVLRPRVPPQRLGALTLAAGVAVARGLEEISGRRAELKWPNDVLIGDRKVAGILTEGTLVGSELSAAVVGIGINIDWGEADLPAELRGRATSLALEMEGRPVPRRAEILGRVLVELEAAYEAIHHDPGGILDEARERSALLGEDVTLTWPDGHSATGRAVAITSDGALQVSIDGRTQAVHAADVERVRPAGET